MTHDPRTIANLILDMAQKRPQTPPISGMKLQAMIFFLHARYLHEHNGRPAIKGMFEALPEGAILKPLVRSLPPDGNPIGRKRAFSLNLVTGETRPLIQPVDQNIITLIPPLLEKTAYMPDDLVLSLIKTPDGPWAYTRNAVSRGKAVTYFITHETILARTGAMKSLVPS